MSNPLEDHFRRAASQFNDEQRAQRYESVRIKIARLEGWRDHDFPRIDAMFQFMEPFLHNANKYLLNDTGNISVVLDLGNDFRYSTLTPSFIIALDWVSKGSKQMVYCITEPDSIEISTAVRGYSQSTRITSEALSDTRYIAEEVAQRINFLNTSSLGTGHISYSNLIFKHMPLADYIEKYRDGDYFNEQIEQLQTEMRGI